MGPVKLTSNAVLLGVIALAAIVGGIVLAALNRSIPDYLPTVAVASLGALAGVTFPGAAQVALTPLPTLTDQKANLDSLTARIEALAARPSAHEAATGTVQQADPTAGV